MAGGRISCVNAIVPPVPQATDEGPDASRSLSRAALAFAAATGFGSVVAARADVPGEPLGLRPSFSVPTGLLVGWGAGVAAPWPLPLTALVAARSAVGGLERRPGISRPGVLCVGVGLCCLVGTVVEPVTRRLADRPTSVRLAVAINVAASVGLIVSGVRAERIRRSLEDRPPTVS